MLVRSFGFRHHIQDRGHDQDGSRVAAPQAFFLLAGIFRSEACTFYSTKKAGKKYFLKLSNSEEFRL